MITRRFLSTTTTKLLFSSSVPSFFTSTTKRFYSSSNDMMDFRDGGGDNNFIDSNDFYSASANENDYDEYSGGGGGSSKRGGFIMGHGMNPADYASSGIHGPAATVARRDMNPDTQGKHAQDFHNAKLGRCVLCDENIGSWAGHIVFVSHQARLSIVERVIGGSCGPPRYVVDRWWQLLNVDPEGMLLNRIRSLSSDANSEKRRERLIYLLRFLQANGVLKVALGVYDDETKSFGRSNVFERFEMVGDNVVKVVFYDRLQSLMPITDGGAGGKMAQIQQLIDSNEGLLQAFDYLELDKIIGTSLSQSKFKSDVMEALFGELQTYLWAVTHHWNTPVEYPAINAAAGPELRYLEAVVRHTLLELTDCILLFAAESSVTRAAGLIQREYKGSNMRKPIPLSKSEMERRRLFMMFQNNSNSNNRQNNQNNAQDNKNNKKMLSDDFFLIDSSKYAMRPFVASESQPIPPHILNENGNGNNNGGGSGDSDDSFGLSVLKPLAQRLAEEEEKKRLKEASWKIPAPYFVQGNKMMDDAEMAFDDFYKRMIVASKMEIEVEMVDGDDEENVNDNNSTNDEKEEKRQQEERKPQIVMASNGLSQKPVELKHVAAFLVENDKYYLGENFEDKSVSQFYTSSSSATGFSESTKTQKQPSLVTQASLRDFMLRSTLEPLILNKKEQQEQQAWTNF